MVQACFSIILCDIFNIPELQRAPTSTVVMSLFISMLADSYSSGAISNAVAWSKHDIRCTVVCG